MDGSVRTCASFAPVRRLSRWLVNGDASCRSDELKSPDTQSFLNIYSIIKKNNTNGRVDVDPEPKSFEKPDLEPKSFIKPATKTHVLRFRMLADTLTKVAG